MGTGWDADGILLIAGTGSICLGQAEGGKVQCRAGGFGHLIDDEGSAYALGRDILSAVVRAQDGRSEATSLSASVFRCLGISSMPELVNYVYDSTHTKKEIADLARLLSLPENRGDACAEQIMDKAVEGLTELVRAVWRNMEEHRGEARLPLVLHGSVLKRNEAIAARLTGRLAKELPRIQVTEPRADGAHGAVGLARASLSGI